MSVAKESVDVGKELCLEPTWAFNENWSDVRANLQEGALDLEMKSFKMFGLKASVLSCSQGVFKAECEHYSAQLEKAAKASSSSAHVDAYDLVLGTTTIGAAKKATTKPSTKPKFSSLIVGVDVPAA